MKRETKESEEHLMPVYHNDEMECWCQDADGDKATVRKRVW